MWAAVWSLKARATRSPACGATLTIPLDASNSNYAAWQRSANLSVIASAQITLDQNAAGQGWYVDSSPLDSTDDYLPTSNPEVWQAKAGSAAVGKMDMLSILLHEYGLLQRGHCPGVPLRITT